MNNLMSSLDRSQDQYDFSSVRRATAALQRIAGLHAHAGEDAAPHPDRLVTIATDDGGSFDMPYEVKTVVDRRDQLLTFKAMHGNALLIAPSLSGAMAEQCRELGIQFIDHAGNCFLRQPGVFVFVSGAKSIASREKRAAQRGLTPAVLRVVLAVLTQPALLNSNVRRIAEVAAISRGAAAEAIIMLEESGFFTGASTGGRVLAMPERWLDAWTEGYLGRIRPKLAKHRMSAAAPIPAVLERVNPGMDEVALGGEAAAAHRGLGLKPGRLTLYLQLENQDVMRHLTQELKLRSDPDGKIELVQIFWNTRELPSFPTVPDALIYADLVDSGDNRSMETAARLKQEICDHVTRAA